jgi:transcriptional regulator, DeoR family
MEAKNLLKRTYGGAVLPDTLHPGHTNIVSIRKDKNIKEKE